MSSHTSLVVERMQDSYLGGPVITTDANGRIQFTRGASHPGSQDLFRLQSGVTGPNVMSMRGAADAGRASGFFELIVSDTCGLYTQGVLASDGGSAAVGNIANLAQFMIGANSDIADGATAAIYVSFSNIANLAHLKAWRGGEVNPRFTIGRDGELRWGPGSTAYDVELVRSAVGTLQVVAGSNTLMQVDDPPANTDTGLLIRCNTGTSTLRRVTQGVVDSGGAGFRLLRVPN